MNINKIFSSLLGGVLLMGVSACTDEVEYTPAESVAADGVYLSISETNVVDIPTDANEVSIMLYRVNADDELTVGLSGQVLDAEGSPADAVFSVPTEVTFPKGATEVPIEIGVVFGDVTPEEEYTLNLKVNTDAGNPYGVTEREYIITYAPWSEWELYADGKEGYATVTLSVFLKGTAELPLYERKSLVNENKIQYMFPDPLSLDLDDPEFDVLKDCDWYYIFNIDKTKTITIDGKQCYRVTTNIVDTQKPYAGGEARLFACAWSIFADLLGAPEANIDALLERNNFKQSYFDADAGLISVYTLMVAVDGADVYPQSHAYEYVLLPGFHDYWIELAYLGNFVDESKSESAVVEVTRCPDIASYAYECVKGEPTAAEVKQIVEDIKANTEAQLIFDENTNLMFQLSENGTYTIVVVGYDEGGNAVYDTSYTFEYNTVMQESEWESIGWASYTDGFFINPWYNPTMGGQTWDVEIEEHKDRAGYFRIVNPYAEWPINLSVGGALIDSKKYYLYINAEDPDGVYIEDSNSGINLGIATGDQTGYSILGSMAYMFIQAGNPFELVKQNGWCGTLKNGIITFDAGTLTYAESEYNEGKAIYANLDPNNPIYENPKMENPDWFFGTGRFKVDMSSIERAPRRAAVNGQHASKAAISKRAANASSHVIKECAKAKGFRASKMTDKQRDNFGKSETPLMRF